MNFIFTPDDILTFNVDFVSNGNNYTKITVSPNARVGLSYDNTVVSNPGGAIESEYRQIILASPATGDLLTWLQANGTKQ